MRKPDTIRPLTIKPNVLKFAHASVLITQGNTHVICTATIDDKVPPHLKGKGTGWITAEYAMLPCATSSRTSRSKMLSSGRTHEIQRLIGRSLRSIVDLSAIGERTITIDCDVIQADGGTRTASISGAFVALHCALNSMLKKNLIKTMPMSDYCAAVSVGIVDGKPLLDLCYEEDVNASVDMNVVMTGSGKFVEIQGTGEEATFDDKELSAMLRLAKQGITQIISTQKRILKWTPQNRK